MLEFPYREAGVFLLFLKECLLRVVASFAMGRRKASFQSSQYLLWGYNRYCNG